MPLKENETFLEYRKRLMDQISPSFCAAKWLNATIWLNSGKTVSCHHPPSHQIDTSKLEEDPSAIHNTSHKQEMRRQMLVGRRPSECEYCWKIEDIGKDHISDRVFKTFIFDDKDIEKISKEEPSVRVVPRYLEIAFDRTCNFACSYCNPSFSTTWKKDILNFGPYQGLSTDKRNHYTHLHEDSDAESPDENPYIRAFWRWWPELSQNLKVLRVTGGEPLLSPHFWNLMEKVGQLEGRTFELAVNSNLGSSPKVIQRLIDASHKIEHLEIFTSNEAFGIQAEYIRDGLQFSLWKENVENLMTEGKVRRLHCMMTINSLCLFSISEFLDLCLNWKQKFGRENPTLNMNMLRFPTFQSPLVLPDHILSDLVARFEDWYDRNRQNPLLLDFERDQIERSISYLKNVKTATADAEDKGSLQKDLARYLKEYDRRRKKSYRLAFPEMFSSWIDSMET